MKKYVKPELFYEHFELSQHIADCGWEMQYATKESCNATPDLDHWAGYEGDTVFTLEPSCTITDWEQYCYENGSAANSAAGLFIS